MMMMIKRQAELIGFFFSFMPCFEGLGLEIWNFKKLAAMISILCIQFHASEHGMKEMTRNIILVLGCLDLEEKKLIESQLN